MVSVVMCMCRLVVIRPYSSLAEVVFSHYLCLSCSYYPSKSSNNHLSASYVLFKQVIYIHLCLHHSYYSASHLYSSISVSFVSKFWQNGRLKLFPVGQRRITIPETPNGQTISPACGSKLGRLSGFTFSV